MKLPSYSALILGLAAAIIFGRMEINSISNSTNSTAAISYIYLPFFCFAAFLTFAIIGFCLGIIGQSLIDRNYFKKRSNILRFILALIISVLSLGYFATLAMEVTNTKLSVDRIATMNEKELEQAYSERPKNTFHNYDIFILGAIAVNPNTSSQLLDKIAHLHDPRMNDRLGSIFNLTKENGRGFSVLRLVAMHPNLDFSTLSYFANSSDCARLSAIAENNRLSVDLFRKIYDKHSACEGIEWGFVVNRNTPADILRAMAKQAEHKSYTNLLREHPNMPPDLK